MTTPLHSKIKISNENNYFSNIGVDLIRVIKQKGSGMTKERQLHKTWEEKAKNLKRISGHTYSTGTLFLLRVATSFYIEKHIKL